jgi:predicted ATP-dependent endonuclease of OLD family
MLMKRLSVAKLGQIENADVTFGDLTVLVGRQASGKTIFLEILKLAVDVGYIHSPLTKHGLDWDKNIGTFLDIYLGEGMQGVLKADTRITVDHEVLSLDAYVRRRKASSNRLFYKYRRSAY